MIHATKGEGIHKKIKQAFIAFYDAFASKCLLLELQMPVDKFKIKSFSKEVEALYYLLRQKKRKQAEQADKGIYILKHGKKIKKIFVITRLAN